MNLHRAAAATHCPSEQQGVRDPFTIALLPSIPSSPGKLLLQVIDEMLDEVMRVQRNRHRRPSGYAHLGQGSLRDSASHILHLPSHKTHQAANYHGLRCTPCAIPRRYPAEQAQCELPLACLFKNPYGTMADGVRCSLADAPSR